MLRSMTIAGVMIALFLDTSVAVPEARGGDCELAQRYYKLAQDRLRGFDQDEAAAYLERAADACPEYAYAQELGELKARSGEDTDKRRAVDAFLHAYSLASSDTERAQSLWKYAELLNNEGDPQNAYGLVLEAKRLDDSNKEILALATEVQTSVENPTRDQLVRGLTDSLYKPIIIAAAAATTSPDGAPPGSKPATASVGVPVAGAQEDTTFVPIHFEFDSTNVDEKTGKNIEVLASALVDNRLSGSAFVFVGHADVRGAEAYNMVLSKRRADVIFDAVVELEPRLATRISVTGRGETEPLDSGSTEEAHWRNRRLQIVIE